MKNNLLIQIIDRPGCFERDIYLFYKRDRVTFLIQGDTAVEIGEGVCPDKPTLRLGPEELQGLVDALSEKGIKPKQGFIEGKLEATDKHLEDMRRLVFKDQPPTN